jgi:hypothetical protein
LLGGSRFSLRKGNSSGFDGATTFNQLDVYYAVRRILFAVMLVVIMLNAVILSVAVPFCQDQSNLTSVFRATNNATSLSSSPFQSLM